jgi:hypothetical protein
VVVEVVDGHHNQIIQVELEEQQEQVVVEQVQEHQE